MLITLFTIEYLLNKKRNERITKNTPTPTKKKAIGKNVSETRYPKVKIIAE